MPNPASTKKDDDESATKRLRSKPVVQACDTCRRKRIRCNGAKESGEPCPNCVAFKTECTYNVPLKKHGPAKGYVRLLEARIAKLESLLSEDGCDIEKEVGAPLDKDSVRRGSAPSAPRTQRAVLSGSSSRSSGDETAPTSLASPSYIGHGSDYPTSDDEFIDSTLGPCLAGLTLDPVHKRFLGKSSAISMIKTAIILKAEGEGTTPNCLTGIHRRPQFWTPPSWERLVVEEEHPDYKFPDADLMTSLVKIYFDVTHYLGPFLHQPTFLRDFQEGLHFRDPKFAAILLMVCAIASRYSDDERVFVKELDSTYSPQSAGWQWFHQVQVVRRSLFAPTTLHDLQLYNLFFMFLAGSQAPHTAWVVVGHAIRLAQDAGVHRRKFYGTQRTLESELWRRSFWCLISHERHISAALGRPYSIEDEEIDADLPVECDDEYLVHPDPDKAFKQPPDKPSRMQYFTLLLKKIRILGRSLRAIYTSRKYQALFGRNEQDWEQRVLADMDSSANQWFDSIPPHLRWMPTCGDPITFRQSACLHFMYYHNQILVHRPFISTKQTPLSLSCLAICNNAARCIIGIADALRQRGHKLPVVVAPTFTASMFLLLQVWGSKRTRSAVDPEKAMAEVHKGLLILKWLESRWSIAGALWDIVYELGLLSDLPLPLPRASGGSKRAREEGLTPETPPVAGGQRISEFLYSHRSDQPSSLATMQSHSTQGHSDAVPHPFVFPENDLGASYPQACWGLSSQAGPSGQLSMFGSTAGSSAAAAQTHFQDHAIYYQLAGSDLHAIGNLTDSAHVFGGGYREGQGQILSDTSAVPSLTEEYSVHGPSTDFPPQYNGGTTAMGPSNAQGRTDTVGAGNGGGFDQDTLTMLSSCPTGFDFEDWGNYIDSMDVFLHGPGPFSNPSGSI
ncbi:hypothetical protein OE88DRAFT_303307 [Heliocybe sulcata]|uniref:Zn(2)-C6 fungal-type domain-containing protein n=1 Tax=Heliocybe sulcata TaxID=5364 RepID=A0A5C3N858_9AGAM|nr:hypothetical protein OE88DRAFT_303307 [Heliocybe sulcata]